MRWLKKKVRSALPIVVFGITFGGLCLSIAIVHVPCALANPVTYTFSAKWGISGPGNGQFSAPFDVEADPSGTFYYVADRNNHRIQKFDTSGGYITELGTGSPSSADGQFNSPRGVAVDWQGNIYVADTLNNRIQKFNSSGVFQTKWGSLGQDAGQFSCEVLPVTVHLDENAESIPNGVEVASL